MNIAILGTSTQGQQPQLLGSVNVDANDISHRPTAAAVPGNDQAQRPTRKERAIHTVCDLNRPACELRCDLSKGDNSDISIRAGDKAFETDKALRSVSC
jgi:hypothetical protein